MSAFHFGLKSFCALALLAVLPQGAHAAVAAPTKPVSAKPLTAPDIQSDSRKLQAILDKEGEIAPAPVEPVQASAPQTILVMPSAAAAAPPPEPPVLQPAPLQPLTPPAAAMEPALVAEPAPSLREVVQETPSIGFNDPSVESGAWYEWTSDPASVFTACIAFFTFLLALAGSYYVYNSAATSRRQLRAYVFIAGSEINGVAAHTQPVAQLVIRNTGQTPAHDVMVYGNMIFDEFPLKKDLPVLVFSDPQLTRENLGPGSERYKWEYALTPLTEDQLARMHAGTHALYVYGEIRYRDVFRKKRHTKYLYYTGGNMGIRGSILGGYPEGNEAV